MIRTQQNHVLRTMKNQKELVLTAFLSILVILWSFEMSRIFDMRTPFLMSAVQYMIIGSDDVQTNREHDFLRVKCPKCPASSFFVSNFQEDLVLRPSCSPDELKRAIGTGPSTPTGSHHQYKARFPSPLYEVRHILQEPIHITSVIQIDVNFHSEIPVHRNLLCFAMRHYLDSECRTGTNSLCRNLILK